MSNFGVIKDTFTNILLESYTTENKEEAKTLYKGFVKLLKEDEILKKQFMVYKNLENKTIESESLALEYIKENINFFRRHDKELIKKSNNKLMSLLGENKVVEPKSYYESLSVLISEDINTSNIDRRYEALKNLKEWVMSEKPEVIEESDVLIKENLDVSKFLEIAVSKYNEKYKDLNESEKGLIKMMSKGTVSDKETYLKETVKEVVGLINEHLDKDVDVTTKTALLETKDVVYRMLDEQAGVNDNIKKLFTLRESLKQ